MKNLLKKKHWIVVGVVLAILLVAGGLAYWLWPKPIEKKSEVAATPVAPVEKVEEKKEVVEKLYVFKKDERYGLLDKEGKVTVEAKYDYIGDCKEGMYQFYTKESSQGEEVKFYYGFLNAEGKVAIPALYTYASDFNGGWAFVETANESMYINPKNEIMLMQSTIKKLDPTYRLAYYNDVSYLKNGVVEIYAETDENNQGTYKYGLADLKGKWITKPKYNYIGRFENGLAVVNIGGELSDGGVYGGKFGYINAKGEEVIPLEYDDASGFKEGLAKVGTTDGGSGKFKYGYIDETGKGVIKFDYDVAEDFSEGLALVGKSIGEFSYSYDFIDKAGKKVIDCSKYDMKFGRYESVESSNFYNGVAWFSKNEAGKQKFGVIDKTGKVVIKPTYSSPITFDKNGYAVATTKIEENGDQSYIIIDKNNTNVLNETFSGYTYYPDTIFDENGIVKVSKRYHDTVLDAYINKDGKYIWKEEGYDGPKEMTVKNAKELVDAIGDNRIINITGDIDLGDVLEGHQITNKKVTVSQEEGLVISDVTNLTIRGTSKGGRAKITTPLGGIAKVLYFKGARYLALENIEVGHKSETFCDGAVLKFEKSYNINLINADLYGCGTYGVTTYDVDNLSIKDSIIRECTYGILDLSGQYKFGNTITLENCIMKDTKGYDMICANNVTLELKKCEITGNGGESLIRAIGSDIKLTQNKISGNTSKNYLSESCSEYQIEKKENQFKDNTFTVGE